MRLKCTLGPRSGETIELDPTQIYIFGREEQSDGVSIVLKSATVSRRHCQMGFENGLPYIQDLGSSNGIRVNRTKIEFGPLNPGDFIQMGEFGFVLEDDGPSSVSQSRPSVTKKKSVATKNFEIPKERESVSSTASGSLLNSKLAEDVKAHWGRFSQIDLSKRIALLLLTMGLLVHFIITSSLISEARRGFLRLSFETGRSMVKSLADRNRRELAEGRYFMLDCEDFARKTPGVVKAVLYDPRGRAVCPVGGENRADELVDLALQRGEAVDNCNEAVVYGGDDVCAFLLPIREWKDQQGQYVMVGLARIHYKPKDAFEAVSNLDGMKFKFLVLSLAALFLVWWLWKRWVLAEIAFITEATHLGVTGAVQKVENPASFADLDPLIAEINKLISKGNQGLSSNSSASSEEASFLHSLLAQVLLLEERAVMVVDRDNHFIAASASLPEVVPVDVSRANVHITEAVTDTHLQGELIVLLNDIAQSSEVIDRALSAAERVYQARAMPIFLKEEYVAALLIF